MSRDIAAVRVLAACLALLAACRPAAAEVVTVTVTGDEVELGYADRHIVMHGNAEIVAQSEEDPTRRVRIHGDTVKGDFRTQQFEAQGNVLLVTPEGSFRGKSVWYDATTSEFVLDQAAMMLGLREVDGQKICGFAYGLRAEQRANITYVLRGRITTCDRTDPHYALEFKSIARDEISGKTVVKGGALRIYGVRIPLIPRVSFTVGGPGGDKPGFTLVPRYSSRDGVYLQWQVPLSADDSATESLLQLRLTSRRSVTGYLSVERPLGSWSGHLMTSFTEDVINDLDERVSIDRLPEVGFARDWATGSLGGADVTGGITLGRYREENRDGGPDVKDDRAMAELRVTGNRDEWEAGAGKWWWVGARQMWYQSGADYTDLEFAVGAGAEILRGMPTSLTLRHHALSGRTPFEFDDVDIESELLARTQAPLGDEWDLGLMGRWDLHQDALRDYEVELRKRAHCLTWVGSYRDIGNRIMVGVELNGLWGNTEPYPQRSIADGPPPYWQENAALEPPAAE